VQAMLPEGFPFHQFIITTTSPSCSYIVLVLRNHGLYFVYIFKIEFPSCARELVVWHLSLPLMNSFNKTEAAFCTAGYASSGFILSSV